MSTATASPTGPIPGRIRHAAPFSPAAPARTATRGIPRKVPTTSTTCSGCCTNSRLRNAWCHARSRAAREQTRFGALYFGSTAPAMTEALEALEERGIHLDTMRVRAFPFHDDILDFVTVHDRVFVVEQNRDAQLRTLLMS